MLPRSGWSTLAAQPAEQAGLAASPFVSVVAPGLLALPIAGGRGWPTRHSSRPVPGRRVDHCPNDVAVGGNVPGDAATGTGIDDDVARLAAAKGVAERSHWELVGLDAAVLLALALFVGPAVILLHGPSRGRGHYPLKSPLPGHDRMSVRAFRGRAPRGGIASLHPNKMQPARSDINAVTAGVSRALAALQASLSGLPFHASRLTAITSRIRCSISLL